MFLDGQQSDGDNQQCVSTTILDDDILEDTETFSLSATGNSLVNVINGEVTVLIQEDPIDCKCIVIIKRAII